MNTKHKTQIYKESHCICSMWGINGACWCNGW